MEFYCGSFFYLRTLLLSSSCLRSPLGQRVRVYGGNDFVEWGQEGQAEEEPREMAKELCPHPMSVCSQAEE